MMCFGCEFQLNQIQNIDNNCKPLQLFQKEEENRSERDFIEIGAEIGAEICQNTIYTHKNTYFIYFSI